VARDDFSGGGVMHFQLRDDGREDVEAGHELLRELLVARDGESGHVGRGGGIEIRIGSHGRSPSFLSVLVDGE
jgi:hypothetical protein